MVGELRNLGYDATCSCDEYNPKTFENMTEEQALAKLKSSGVDAVLTVVLLDKTQERAIMYRVVYNIRHTASTITASGVIPERCMGGSIQKAIIQKTLNTSGKPISTRSIKTNYSIPRRASLLIRRLLSEWEEHGRLITLNMLKKRY